MAITKVEKSISFEKGYIMFIMKLSFLLVKDVFSFADLIDKNSWNG